MSNQVTPILTHVASGFLQGTGISVSPKLTAALNVFKTSGLSGTIRSILSQQDIESVAPGITGALYSLPIFITGRDGNIDLVSKIEDRAAKILPPGPIGIQQFSTTLGQASAFISVSFQWKGSMAELSNKSFGDFGLGVENFEDLASSGATKIFASPAGKTNVAAISESFSNLGQLFDTSDMYKLGDPSNLINQINDLGLGSVGNLDEKLAAVGVSDISAASPAVLAQVLKTLSKDDVAKIVEASGAKVNANQLTTGADLLDATKLLPENLASSLPGRSFAGLGNAMVDFGGKFKDTIGAASFLKTIEMPSLPNLKNIKEPVSSSISQQITANLGNGSGAFNVPTLMEMIGTAAGYKHTDAFEFSNSAQEQILNSDYGISFSEAIDNLQLAITGNGDISLAMQEITAVVADINNSGKLTLIELIQKANEKMLASRDQLKLEGENLLVSKIGEGSAWYDITKVGITPSSIDTQSLLSFATQVHTYGVDRQNTGYNELFTNLATNNQYGDAVRAALIEGRSLENQAMVGIRTAAKADPTAYLKSIQSRS